MKKIMLVVLCITLAMTGAPRAKAEEPAVRITFNGGGITAPETDDVRIDGSTVTIRDKGTYVLSGALENGQIIVDAGGKDDVTLVLNGVTVANEAGPALLIENANITVLRLAPGTENALISGTAVDVLNTPADGSAKGGAIHAKDSLRIEGEGSLTVGGYLNNGIHTSNSLTVLGGNITVEAVNHGVKGKDAVLIEGGTLRVTAGKDGIVSNDTTGEGYGVVTIRGGTLTVNAAGDGIQAETLLDISGGTLDITAGGGSEGVEHGASEDWGGFGGGRGGWGFGGPGYDFAEPVDDSASAKGLKSGVAVTVSGGDITVDAADDAVHANGSVTVSGGTLTLSSGDDGIHADNELTVEDGVITVLTSYEGMEANQILLAGGVMDVTSSDDGLNACGGPSVFGMGGGHGGFGGPGGRGFGSRDSGQTGDEAEDLPLLRITGGTLRVNAEGDGLDSNGSIVIEGGEIIVDGPLYGMNGALDSGAENGGSCEIHGGVVLAIGAAGMAETFDNTSTQCAFQLTMQGISAGDEIVITDSKGTVIFRHTAAKACASIVFSSPELTVGETYTVTAGGQSAQVTQTSVSTGGQPMRWGW